MQQVKQRLIIIAIIDRIHGNHVERRSKARHPYKPCHAKTYLIIQLPFLQKGGHFLYAGFVHLLVF
uniref:Uncharacterized protein n=1 Tax=Setaria italica TaxID=4555 RepID=K4AHR1_SETIT